MEVFWSGRGPRRETRHDWNEVRSPGVQILGVEEIPEEMLPVPTSL